jgi:hypothetical protein
VNEVDSRRTIVVRQPQISCETYTQHLLQSRRTSAGAQLDISRLDWLRTILSSFLPITDGILRKIQVSTGTSKQTAVFWDVAQCILVDTVQIARTNTPEGSPLQERFSFKTTMINVPTAPPPSLAGSMTALCKTSCTARTLWHHLILESDVSLSFWLHKSAFRHRVPHVPNTVCTHKRTRLSPNRSQSRFVMKCHDQS